MHPFVLCYDLRRPWMGYTCWAVLLAWVGPPQGGHAWAHISGWAYLLALARSLGFLARLIYQDRLRNSRKTFLFISLFEEFYECPRPCIRARQ